MQVFVIAIPDQPLSNFELERYARQLEIPNFRGVFMIETLSAEHPYPVECGIVNFNTHTHTHTAGKSLGVLLQKQGPENIF